METKTKKERGVACETEFLISICKLVSSIIGCLPEDDREDMLELLGVMSSPQTKEEMAAAEETIREILQPKTGAVVRMVLPNDRDGESRKWAEFTGRRVRDFRKQAGLTQAELASRADLPQSHISRIENNEVSPNRITLTKIAKALGRPIGDLDPSA